MTLEARLAAVRRRMEEAGAAALLLASPVNVGYLTGLGAVFEGDAAAVLAVEPDAVHVYTDSRYETAAYEAAAGQPFEVTIVERTTLVEAAERLAIGAGATIAVEDSLPYADVAALMRAFSGEVLPVSGWVEDVRRVKDAGEIELIASAQHIADEAFSALLGTVRAGLTEREVALELELLMRRAGSEGVAFAPIVASGPNSALPHAGVTDRRIEHGDFLKLDFGAVVGGYRSDMTRTVVVGTASDRQREMHAAVLEANRAGVAAVKAGMTGAEVDAVARDVLESRGVEGAFRHGLGHGVGLDVHERPSLSPRGTSPLAAGEVVTVEPGVYVPGLGGVRIEDLVVVEEDGCRVLSTSPRELIEL